MRRSDEVKEFRLWNLRQLVDAAGGVNAAARILGRHNSQVTDLCGPHPKRAIGDRVAAAIETAFKLQPGALDHPPPKETNNGNPIMSQIASTLAHMSDEEKDFVLAITKWLAHRSVAKSNPTTEQGKIVLSEVADEIEASSIKTIAPPEGHKSTPPQEKPPIKPTRKRTNVSAEKQ